MQTTRKKSSAAAAAAAETVANIEDLLSQILLRLPARSVYRFQCVSKRWLSLISDPKFHQLRNPNSKISALLPSTTKENYFNTIPLGNGNHPPPSQVINPYKFLDQSLVGPHASTCWILQSCNGLLLCMAYSGERSRCRDTFSSTLCVVNPTTNQFSALSYPRIIGEYLDQVYFGLAFDPSRSPHYKVVCIHLVWEHTIDIYSSETQAWKLVEMYDFRPVQYAHMRQGAVYCNGALHWITDPNTLFSLDQDLDGNPIIKEHDFMQYFDVDKEESVDCAVSSPPLVISCTNLNMWNIEYRYFGESGGHLHLIDIYKKSIFQFDVMEMGNDYSGWFVKYHVDLDPVAAALPEMLHQFSYIPAVVLIVASEEKEDSEEEDSSPQLLLHILGELISYNIKNKTFKKSSITTGNCFVVEDCSPGYYMETLASVR